jgi:hypothetical protein
VNDADNVFIFGSGPFSMQPGEEIRFVTMITVGENYDDMISNVEKSYEILSRSFQFTKAPDPPEVTAVPGDKKITLYWNDRAELSFDPTLGFDFEGYKIYRSDDNGLTWGDPITNNKGVLIGFHPIAQIDLNNEIKGNFPLAVDGVQYYLGDNTGINRIWSDTTVINGKKYLYAVSAYDRGSDTLGIVPAETPRLIGGLNVVEVTSHGYASGYESGLVQYTQLSGNSNANFELNMLDPQRLKNESYLIAVNDSIPPKSISVENSLNEVLVSNMSSLDGSSYALFDGIQLWVYDWQTVVFISDQSGFTTNSVSNYTSEALAPSSNPKFRKPTRYRVIFFDSDVDTSLNNIPVKFKVFDYFDSEQAQVIVVNKDTIPGWSPEDDVRFVESIDGELKFTWGFTLNPPANTEIVPIWPTSGDSLILEFSREMTSQDTYRITSTQPSFRNSNVILDQIAVVPNPYVVAAGWEVPPSSALGRGERKMEFINLPPRATIRIFTINGELVKKIEHSSQSIFSDSASWDLLSDEGRELAYGIYIFHVEVPGVGEKIGKLGIIK